MISEVFEQHLKSLAQELGITEMKRIPIMDIAVEDWVRLKCQYGCPVYGKRLTCPPYSPAPEAMRKILESYSTAYLIRYDVPSEHNSTGIEAHEDAMSDAVNSFFKLEKFAFLNGYRKTFVFGLNYCPGCDTCVVQSGESSHCRYPVIMRPSMEACGIDVQKTLENSGWEKTVKGRNRLRPEDTISMISMILVE
jgi:predicted metal-binding protein